MGLIKQAMGQEDEQEMPESPAAERDEHTGPDAEPPDDAGGVDASMQEEGGEGPGIDDPAYQEALKVAMGVVKLLQKVPLKKSPTTRRVTLVNT